MELGSTYSKSFRHAYKQPTTTAPDAGSFVRSLVRIGQREPTARQHLQESLANGSIFHHLNSANQGNLFDSLSSLTLAAILYDPEATYPGNPESRSGPRGLSQVDKRCGKQSRPSRPFVSQCIDLGIVASIWSNVITSITSQASGRNNSGRRSPHGKCRPVLFRQKRSSTRIGTLQRFNRS